LRAPGGVGIVGAEQHPFPLEIANMSTSALKSAAVGLAWFVGYMLVTKLVVKPAAVKFGVPLLKDL
jgi:hypothetical protein